MTNYSPGTSVHPFAQRFGHLVGAEIPTVADAMKTFTDSLSQPINALYRNQISDLVATTHLTVVDARFKYDEVWALGFCTVTDVILANYPEKDFAAKIAESLAAAAQMTYAELKADAAKVSGWAEGKSADDVAAALRGESDGPISAMSKAAKSDDYWLYSRYFGIGLVKTMEIVGADVDTTLMEKWVKTDLGKSPFKAVGDLDQWKALNSKLVMMETLMKEVEIREKKKMADRLEEKAAAAVKRAEREELMKKEVDEAATKE